MTDNTCWPSIDGLDVSEHQAAKLREALTRPLAIFSGGPGTGKTYSAAKLIGRILETHGDGQIAIAAPTGKAAVRISEVMQGYGIGLRARTIHSLLKVSASSERGGWSFEHDETNPLPFKFIIVDESSMIDTGLAAAFFRACGPGTHVLLVGDTGQLAPVGHGRPLYDLIAAGVPTGELTEVRRNSGQIVAACHRIRQGQTFSVCPRLEPDEGLNLVMLPAGSPNAAIAKVIATIKAIGRKGLVDPIWDCQVIVAVNAKSPLGRKNINKELQAALNPTGTRAGDNPFRVNDKIVCLQNGFYPVVEDAPGGLNDEASDGKVFVANGEQAAVKHVEPNITIAQLDAPARMIKIPRGEEGGSGCSWDLAYGTSCHKAQGSEWPVVFVVLDEYPGARRVCSREWLYTGMSRAKVACFLVGKLGTAHGMIRREAIRKRKTFLKELITG